MKKVLDLHIVLTENRRVTGGNAEIGMVLFEGTADHPNFRGRVLPGGCDTQTRIGNRVHLSARYMLEGVDYAGTQCRMFIENNGSLDLSLGDPVTHTIPRIITDSPNLAWLETATLSGTVSPEGENRVRIQIFGEDTP